MTIPIEIISGMPFIKLKVWNNDLSMDLNNVLIDTGSASTILKLDVVEEIGLTVNSGDHLGRISGVGGSEFVFFKTVQALEVNGIKVENFQVDIGVMNYGFEFDGIIGMDFLLNIKSVIDLDEMVMKSKNN